MIGFQWNALRAGDHVRVHRDGSALEDGVVALVDSLHGSNGTGVRMTSATGTAEVVWPSRLAVHNAAGDLDEPCWRCGPGRPGDPPAPAPAAPSARP